MLSVDAATKRILDCVTPMDADRDRETVPLQQALGRILAAPIASPLDFPHWDNSAMDGYAVRWADVQAASSEAPVPLTVVEEIPAGKPPQQSLGSGQAARILTGSMLPAGADTVIMQEQTQRQGDRVLVLAAPEPQAFVRHRASYHRAGEPLLPAGIQLNPPEIAVLAAAQCPTVPVYRRPRIAILSTGDELVTPDHPLQPGQIVDSNQYALAALVQQAGAEPLCQGIVADDPTALRAAISQALAQADWVLSSGGVSVGDYDYVEQLLADLGAEIQIRAVAVKPGKPLTVATFIGDRPPLYFGLPGNPVSALVSFWRFVAPALQKRMGQPGPWRPTFVSARSRHPLKAGGQRETYLWGHVTITEAGWVFDPARGSHSSGNLINLTQTNGLAVVPVGQTQIPADEVVSVMLVGPPRLT